MCKSNYNAPEVILLEIMIYLYSLKVLLILLFGQNENTLFIFENIDAGRLLVFLTSYEEII